MTDIYVYYRIHEGAQSVARESVARVFDALRQSVGVVGRLSRRVDDPLTWLESYQQVPDCAAFESALSRALEGSGLPECVNGERHSEHFVECA